MGACLFLRAQHMFSKLFKKKAAPERQLSHPKDLQEGDMLQLIDSFALPKALKGQTLHVVDVNTYQYQYESETEFVLKGDSGTSIFFTVENNDGEEWANFSIKVQRQDVDDLFTLDQFASIFDSEDLVTIERVNDVDEFERWTAKSYVQGAHPSTAYYYNQDYRGRKIPEHVEDGGEPLEYINLQDPDDMYSVNIEIWDDGETDVSLTITRPITDVVDLFPGSK
jgi:hypothetical protein